jgi:nucleoside-diphosphate kinase
MAVSTKEEYMATVRTAVLVKPDGLQRGLIGEIIGRFERKGLKLVGLKMVQMTDKMLSDWYVEHKDRSFFGDLKSFMGSMPIVAMAWEGVDAVPVVRKLVGTTLGREAEAGSIRGDFGMSQQMNLIHASSSTSDAERELDIVFDKDELFGYNGAMECVIYAEQELKK